MLNVAAFIFTEEELKEGVLEKSDRTKRTYLDPVRVHLIKGQ